MQLVYGILKRMMMTLGLISLFVAFNAWASDHADTAEIAGSPGTDLTDLYVFPSAADASKMVLVMNVSPLIQKGQTIADRSFDPNVLYQFKIDTSSPLDGVEDLVIQMTCKDTGAAQKCTIRGPAKPGKTGTENQLLKKDTRGGEGAVDADFACGTNTKCFAGVRGDPFALDLNQFYCILPDRQTPIGAPAIPLATANTPGVASWCKSTGNLGAADADCKLSISDQLTPQTCSKRPTNEAQNTLGLFNVLSWAVELPKADIGTGKVGIWMTTSVKK